MPIADFRLDTSRRGYGWCSATMVRWCRYGELFDDLGSESAALLLSTRPPWSSTLPISGATPVLRRFLSPYSRISILNWNPNSFWIRGHLSRLIVRFYLLVTRFNIRVRFGVNAIIFNYELPTFSVCLCLQLRQNDSTSPLSGCSSSRCWPFLRSVWSPNGGVGCSILLTFSRFRIIITELYADFIKRAMSS